MKNGLTLVASIFLCVGGGWLSGLSTKTGLHWYSTLNQAPWTPPDFLFPFVWTLLYLLMAFSLWLIEKKPITLALFALQLSLNFAWSWLFFYWKSPLLSLIDICALLVILLWTIRVFYRDCKEAAYLLIPYLFWLCYASTLNLYIEIYN